MTKSIVYSSGTKNTKQLAQTIFDTLKEDIYFGKPNGDVPQSDLYFVGFWAAGNSCGEDIKSFLQKLNGKKIFIFGTAGYNSTKEYFDGILENVKSNIDQSNEIIGTFMCQGKVSEAKMNSIKKLDEAKYNSMKEQLDISQSHPDENDLKNLVVTLQELKSTCNCSCGV